MLVTTPLRDSIPARRRQSRTKLTPMFTLNFPKTPVVDALLADSPRLLMGVIQAFECRGQIALTQDDGPLWIPVVYPIERVTLSMVTGDIGSVREYSCGFIVPVRRGDGVSHKDLDVLKIITSILASHSRKSFRRSVRSW